MGLGVLDQSQRMINVFRSWICRELWACFISSLLAFRKPVEKKLNKAIVGFQWWYDHWSSSSLRAMTKIQDHLHEGQWHDDHGTGIAYKWARCSLLSNLCKRLECLQNICTIASFYLGQLDKIKPDLNVFAFFKARQKNLLKICLAMVKLSNLWRAS